MTRRVLLIGATGFFGSRLAAMLAGMRGLTLALTSRSAERATALGRRLARSGGATIECHAFSHGTTTEATLAALEPWLVIDASGPFQRASYDTARAAILAGANWIDLADDTNYILGFAPALDALARAKGVAAVTGASSTPALSCAIAMDMTRGWRRVDAVDIGIYPAGGADVGRAVIDAVLSYAGAPVPVWTEGQAGSVTGWGRAERVVIEGLGRRYRSAVSTSDHALLPQLIGARTVRFYAGLESPLEHLGLVTLAKMRHAGLISSAEPLAPLLHKLRHLTMQFCGVSGGMTVATRGVDRSGAPVQSGWLLVAKNGHGPNVPVLPALAMTKKLLTEPVPAGASCAVGALSRGEIEAAMAPFDLTVLTSSTAPAFARAA